MYQLPPHHHLHLDYSTHHHHQQQSAAAAAYPFPPPFYLFPNASAVATEQAGGQGEGVLITPTGFDTHNSNNYMTSHLPAVAATHHKPQRHDPPPAGKPSGGGRSRKSATKKAAAAGGGSHHHRGRRKPASEPLRGMGVEQLEQHLRLQEAVSSSSAAAAASATATATKRLLFPKLKSAKKPASSRPVLPQPEAASVTFPDEHYGTPVEYGGAVISTERQRQIQLLQQYQAWVRKVTGAVGNGQPTAAVNNVRSHYAGAGRSSTGNPTSGGGGSVFLHHHHHLQDEISSSAELSSISIPKINNNSNTPSYDDLPTCNGPCCLDQKKSFSSSTAMVQKNSTTGIVIRGERFQEAANYEAPLINSSSNYHRLPAGLVMNYVQNDAVHFTHRDMEAISTTTTTTAAFCRSYPYDTDLNHMPTVDHDEEAQRKGNSSSSTCGVNGGGGNGMAMEYYEFFPSGKTSSSGEKGGTFLKEEYSDDQEEEGGGVEEVEDYLMLEGSGPYVGYGGGEASCLTTSDHHHHHHEQQYYNSSSSGYTCSNTLASNPTTTATTNSISSSLDLSLKLSF